MRADAPMRFAVLCRTIDHLATWQVACVKALAECGEAELVAVLSSSATVLSCSRIESGPAERPVQSPRQGAGETGPTPFLASIPFLALEDAASAGKLDFLFSFVPELPVVEMPSFGIWRLRFGGLDPGMEDGLAFRHAMHQRATGAVELVANGGIMGVERVLHHAVLKARLSPRRTLEELRRAAPGICVGAYRRVTRGSFSAAATATVPQTRPVGRLRIATSLARRRVEATAARFLRERWALGVVRAPIETLLDGGTLPVPDWLGPPRPGRFHADPFPVMSSGQWYALFEMWSWMAGRGWIAVAALDDPSHGPRHAETALDLGCHMSYPGTFRFEGVTYCTPEAWEGGGLHVFRMGSTPSEWTLVDHALAGTPIVDPTLFEHDGRWWLFATLRGQGPETHLHAWYAAKPLGPWTPHPLNPLKSDVRSARPAGAVFRARGALYRPAQDCSFTYGGAVTIHQILRLDPDGFDEIEVARLAGARDWPYRHGVHTLNVFDGRILIDAKRHVFDPFTPFWTLIPHARRWYKRVLGGGRPREPDLQAVYRLSRNT